MDFVMAADRPGEGEDSGSRWTINIDIKGPVQGNRASLMKEAS